MTALPLIFGLVGGASGFSAAKLDPSKRQDKARLTLLGQTLAAFSVACIAGVLVGIVARPALAALDNPQHRFISADKKSPATILESMILRKKLELVGASSEEIADLLSLIEASPNDRTALEPALKRLDETLNLVSRPAGPKAPTHLFTYQPWDFIPPELRPFVFPDKGKMG